MRVIDLVLDKVFEQLFKEKQEKGIGAELNFLVFQYSAEDLIRVIRPYEIAKECGCKFYFGSDAHNPEKLLNIKHGFERIVDISKLEESDKFLL